MLMASEKTQNVTYYAGIMLDAFAIILCSKLCWHNWLKPIYCTWLVVGYAISFCVRGQVLMADKELNETTAIHQYFTYQYFLTNLQLV